MTIDSKTGAAKLTAQWRDNADLLAREGLYAPEDERSSCGVGMVAAIDGEPSRQVVEAGINALRKLWHRGAVDADGMTGDGAGIHLQIPREFFLEHIRATGHEPAEGEKLIVGMVFLPKTDFGALETCRTVIESEILDNGYVLYGWRQVPVDVSVIGEKANATRPEIEQVMFAARGGKDEAAIERELYVLRRRVEKGVREALIQDFYICSLSCRSIIYKGMFLAEQVTSFYPDLLDRRFESNFAIYHQRYSTNTFPTWRLAQPFRMLAHNGEINTVTGNENWTRAHEPKMGSGLLGDSMEDLKPVIQAGSSDSASLDAMFELLCRAGRPAPAAQVLMIPESVGAGGAMPQAHKDMYDYTNSVVEPWDGPAAVCATDGEWLIGAMDRNGLRPMRYVVTADGVLVAGSEAGMVEIPEERITAKGRLSPGGMLAVNLKEGRLYHDREIKDFLAARQPYGEWTARTVHWRRVIRDGDDTLTGEALLRLQHCFGQSLEDMEFILHPMAETGREATGSMGDDAPLAVLSDKYRGLHHFFRQMFSQVTNPPIDSLRERRVMTLRTRLGNLGNVLEEDPAQCDLIQLEGPVLTNASFRDIFGKLDQDAAVIDCTFDPGGGTDALKSALERVRSEAEEAVRGGVIHLVLTDEAIGPDKAPLPMILAAGGVHSHLVHEGLRTFTSLNVRSAECLDVHYFAVLIGVGATTVNAYGAEAAIADRHRRGLLNGVDIETATRNYMNAIEAGLLKIMSKMGISVISSYRGGYCFEAVGLSRAVVARFFPGMRSRISGIGLAGVQSKVLEMHREAHREAPAPLSVGGFYKYRASGERHGHDGKLIHILQSAVGKESYSVYKHYSRGVNSRDPIYLRDLLDFRRTRPALHVDEVESITEIRKRLVAPGISLGALSPEAHETLSIAMNRIGAKSDSGEGGEDPARYKPRPNGDNASSAIKQVASGRFGVTAEYLNNCREIEIKMAQGAKPGEGGQLPGFKVTGLIARLRHSTEGVTLISPPPHHDIYSIEDLAQLIYDLKQINPDATVCVKLVARAGVGTIAAGVAKAKADVILISGHDGGTGASPQSSIKYAGLPWEMGLSEANQVLTLNRLRHTVKLRVDGGVKTGRDVVIGAMLGADEFGVGTASLVAMGCVMVRQCHSNTCPVGVCTQNEALREKFTGTPEKVVNLFTFIAEEVAEILASLGFRSINDVIGRADLLTQVSRGAAHLDDLDLNALLAMADNGGHPRHSTLTERNEVPPTLDERIIRDAEHALTQGEKMQLTYTVRNTDRAVGTRTSSMMTRKYGMNGLKPDHLTVRLRGSAGQSLGAFAVQGLTLEVLGDANDYVGKGLSGGAIILRPPVSSPIVSNENTIIGNTVLYGATAGQLFAAGQAGERFCVRNSGAQAVVEGCGSNGCEYMTGGAAVILGAVGPNFGAGMTGGMAFVYDEDNTFEAQANDETILWRRIETQYWQDVLKVLVQTHVKRTHSRFALTLLNDWELELRNFWQVAPREMVSRLEHPMDSASEAGMRQAGE